MTSTAAHPVAEAIGTDRPARGILAVLVVISVVSALQSSVVVPLISHIPEVFSVSAATASWIVTATTLGASVAAPIISRMADLYGKRLIVVCTLLVTALGSLLVAVSDVFAIAVTGRALQGTAMALIPVSMSIVKEVLPGPKIGSGIALLGGTLGLGTALGLPVAGLLYRWWGWHALFWVTVVIAPLLALAAQLVLPGRSVQQRTGFDVLGSVLFTVALVPFLLALSQGNDWGWAGPAVLGLFGAAVVAGGLWLWWERRAPDPLVDIDIAAGRTVMLTNLSSLLLAGGMFANMYLASQQLANPASVPGGLGLPSETVGLLMIAPAMMIIVLSPVIGPALHRFGGRTVLVAAALAMAAAYLARIWLSGSPTAVVVGAVLVGIGISFGLSAQPMIVMAAVPADRTASANGLNQLFRTVGTSASVAAVAVLTSATSLTTTTGEYATGSTFRLAFIGLAALMALGALLAFLVPGTAGRTGVAESSAEQ
ncbi:MFS transporter [Nakamurella alba]|uniref:MFS transporter n=1 Tax=Nakamurella alba TaxID=2665158 RepID=UPI0018A91E79|nr:MFS transporter [Nakamurella alba]